MLDAPLHFEDVAQAVVPLACENPMSTSSEEAKRLLNLADLVLCYGIVHYVAISWLGTLKLMTCLS